MAKVLIIGGGISGLASAYELARAGVSATLIEARRLGAMASTWTLGGVRQSGRDPAELPLALAAVQRWESLDAELGLATGYRRHGNLRLARTDQEVSTIRTMVASQRALGLALDFLDDRRDIKAIAPAISDTVLAASFCPGDGHADPDMTLHAYAEGARRFGAVLKQGCAALKILTDKGRVTGVETADGPMLADVVIVAAGIHTPALLAPLGALLPLSVKRVCVMQTVAAPPCFEQVFGVANADCAGRQEINGRFRITTGIGDWSGDPEKWTVSTLLPSPQDCADLTARTASLLPVLATLRAERVWGGLIDLTPDALPVLDAPTAYRGLVIGTGFSGHGFGIGPVTGEILSALAQGQSTRFDLAPFRLDRFGDQPRFAPLTLHG